MRVAVLSDIHANIYALEAVLRDCDDRKVDTFWLLGDYVDYNAATKSVLQAVQSLDAQYVIAGNHDACLFLPDVRPSATAHGKLSYEYLCRHLQSRPQDFEWLKGVAGSPMEVISALDIMLVHGTPDDPYWGKFDPGSPGGTEELLLQMDEQKVSILFLGHTHKSFLYTDSGKMIINPGSIGQPRNGCPDAQYAIFEDGNVEFCRVPYDVEATVAENKEAGLPDYLWQRLLIGK